MQKIKQVARDVPAPLLVGVELNPGPGDRVRLSEFERYRVVFLHNEDGLSIRQIAKKMNISHSKLTRLWNELPWDLVRNSVDSMPQRLQQCIDRNGMRTKY